MSFAEGDKVQFNAPLSFLTGTIDSITTTDGTPLYTITVNIPDKFEEQARVALQNFYDSIEIATANSRQTSEVNTARGMNTTKSNSAVESAITDGIEKLNKYTEILNNIHENNGIITLEAEYLQKLSGGRRRRSKKTRRTKRRRSSRKRRA